MTVRSPGMDALITEVSLNINDTAHAVFTTQQVQDALDRTFEDVQYMPLTPNLSYASGGAVSYLEYFAIDRANMPALGWQLAPIHGLQGGHASAGNALRWPVIDRTPQGDEVVGGWEADAKLLNATYADITANLVSNTGADFLRGVFTFSANQYPPVYLLGRRYDIWAAAAELLEKWAVKVAFEFDFTDGARQRFARSQKREALLQLAEAYKQRARPRSITITRGDVHPR